MPGLGLQKDVPLMAIRKLSEQEVMDVSDMLTKVTVNTPKGKVVGFAMGRGNKEGTMAVNFPGLGVQEVQISQIDL